MPHVNIKHYPASLTAEDRSELVSTITSAVQRAFACEGGVISIALEEVRPDNWQSQVYAPEIKGRPDLLIKIPNY